MHDDVRIPDGCVPISSQICRNAALCAFQMPRLPHTLSSQIRANLYARWRRTNPGDRIPHDMITVHADSSTCVFAWQTGKEAASFYLQQVRPCCPPIHMFIISLKLSSLCSYLRILLANRRLCCVGRILSPIARRRKRTPRCRPVPPSTPLPRHPPCPRATSSRCPAARATVTSEWSRNRRTPG